MAQPTVASRLRRRFALLGNDAGLGQALREALPEGWEMVQSARVSDLGDFAEILQHRFLLLDLDDPGLDALDAIDTLRRELMLNIAIICIGGDAALRDAARLARADRFFGRTEAVGVMQRFCAQYGW